MFIPDIICKKRDGKSLTWEELDAFIQGIKCKKVRESQIGALLMAFHLNGFDKDEVELLTKAMMVSGESLEWPLEWKQHMSSLQSMGSTGNKVKPILAGVMAACGLKFPIMSSRGVEDFGGILSKLNTIPGFNGTLTHEGVQQLLSHVDCCVVQQFKDTAPIERIVRDVSSLIGISHNNAIKAACIMARVAAFKLDSVVFEVPVGPSESIKTNEEADDLVQMLVDVSKALAINCRILVTRVSGPVGKMIGQSLEVAETVKCLNGEGSADMHELICKLGGQVLHIAGIAGSAQQGEDLVNKKLKDGSAKKKFMAMLQAQGVNKSDVKALFKHNRDDIISTVLPTANFYTHLACEQSGFVHKIDLQVLNHLMNELAVNTDPRHVCAGGLQLAVQVGSYLNRGELWAKVHHNTRLDVDQINKLKEAITLKLDPPLYDMKIDIREIK